MNLVDRFGRTEPGLDRPVDRVGHRVLGVLGPPRDATRGLPCRAGKGIGFAAFQGLLRGWW
jgi:hypothetical protein